jgi:hypothetical protein
VRNRYLDLLRAAAIVRVIAYHLFGWPWLSILLPAIGIMFAVAGSLTAASLDKRAAGQVITSRLRRLLPPLWLLAAVVVPAMLYLGWTREEGGDEPLSWKLGLWLLPVGDPPGSERGINVWEPLWYVRAYLWFVVLSPLLYRAYKKIGWGAVAAPVVLIAVLDKTDFALPFGRADAAMWDFATYGACWIAGFAHHDGRLARIRPGLVVAASAILGLAALYWLRGQAAEASWDLNDVSESQALWSLAFVLLALRWQPDMSWLQRSPRLDGAVNLLNARAVTIYLWHNVAIAAIWPVLTVVALDDLGGLDGPTDLVASLALTAGAVLAFGWVEDLAAGRKPRLWPTSGPSCSPAVPVARVEEDLASHGDLASRPTGDLGPVGPLGSSAFVESSGVGDPAQRVGLRHGVGTLPDADPVPDLRQGADAWDGPGDRVGDDLSAGPGARRGADPPGGAPAAPWAGGAAAPIVLGESGFVSRQRGYVAPFPEAEVSFGLPDVGSGFGGDGRQGGGSSGPQDVGPGGPDGAGPHAAGPAGPNPASAHAAGPHAAGPHAAGPHGVVRPVASAGPPVQARRHDADDREPAVPWFGGDHDASR